MFDFGGLGWPDWDDWEAQQEAAVSQAEEEALMKKGPPKVADVPQLRPTVWQVIMQSTLDQRCRLKEVHIHDMLNALGINPSAPWPPEDDELWDSFDVEG